MPNASAPPVVLTIAGFDPTCGAGVTADLKAFAANNCYGVACITSLTIQNTLETRASHSVEPGLLREQLGFLLSDVRPRAAKIGMLGDAAIVEVVADALERAEIPAIVLDPVFRASSGAELLDAAGRELLVQRLCPLATVITPNLDEAEMLTGFPVQNLSDMQRAAERLLRFGVRTVVVTGGHLEKPLDLFHDGERPLTFGGDRVRTANTHGTGCTFSAALAAILAHGKQMEDAVVQAKAYVTAALKMSYPIGSGSGPLNHLYRMQEPPRSKNVDPAPQFEFTTR